MRKWIVCCVLVCSLCLNVVLCCENGKGRIKGRIETDTTRVTVVDTVTYMKPVARDSVVVRYVREKVAADRDKPCCASLSLSKPLSEGVEVKDSAWVDVPIVQKRYEDSTYTAWVSGYEAKLDSIRVYARREVVTIKARDQPKRFVVSLNVGYGLTPQNGLQPYVGIGVGYKLFSFGR